MAEQSGLPASIALAWGLQDAPRRGPKRALSLSRVVAAGIAVAARDGLAGVSMARVAAELGVTTMALYRYVPGKDDLVELMVDQALGAPPAAAPPSGWRDALREWAEGVRDAYLANPWTLRAPIVRPPLGPNNVRWLERALAGMRDTPLTVQQKVSTLLVVSGYVRSMAMLASDFAASPAPAGPPEAADYGRLLRELIDPETFPELSEAVASGALSDEDDPGLDFDFRFGLERLLDGVGTLVRAQRREAKKDRSQDNHASSD